MQPQDVAIEEDQGCRGHVQLRPCKAGNWLHSQQERQPMAQRNSSISDTNLLQTRKE